MSQTVRNIFEDGLQLLDCENASVAAVDIRDFVIRGLNAALQKMQLSGRDYFTRKHLVLSIVAGTPNYTMPDYTLNVFTPARLSDGSTLREIGTRGEYELFPQIYLGMASVGPATGKPLGMFVDRFRPPGLGADSTRVIVYFSPTPDADYGATIDISTTPPVYTLSDVTEPSPVVPVPHQFTESILLPLVRWEMTKGRLFRRPERLPLLQSAMEDALEQLGAADPQIKRAGASTDLLEQARQNAKAAARDAYQRTLAK